MFIRWKTFTRQNKYKYAGTTIKTLSAYLVVSVREDGKPRQHQYYLASIDADLGDMANLRYHFWQHVLQRLERFEFEQETIRAIATLIHPRVPYTTHKDQPVEKPRSGAASEPASNDGETATSGITLSSLFKVRGSEQRWEGFFNRLRML